ncbi:MAG: LLM class flavin-dependent oxidoreductase [Chloroflexi bacterium]|nr:LLM class flavin-dependent oxidoreductase [Chloroflexota bacterium]
MNLPDRMKFGIFLGPFHRVGENPTLAMDRDMELVQWLDYLGYDEAWIGEHHSAGWETISSPELFIAAAAERTKHIKLGTGVISLPYHHPFMVANRMVQLDHMTHGRVMLGVGPGALPGDAYMMGIDPTTQREKMDEAMGIILRLFTEDEPITYKSDWFELREAMLQLKPYQRPYMPLSVASVQSPAGVAMAGKYGASVLTITVPRDPSAGPSNLKGLWEIAETSAAEHGQTVDRHEWRLAVPCYLADDRDQALEEVKLGAGRYLREYSEGTNGRKAAFDGPLEDVAEFMRDNGSWIIGTPDDCIESLNRLAEQSGGYGGFLVQTIDWAPREKMLHSFELMARYVMPHFQGSVRSVAASNRWAAERQELLVSGRVQAIDRAHQIYADRQAAGPGQNGSSTNGSGQESGTEAKEEVPKPHAPDNSGSLPTPAPGAIRGAGTTPAGEFELPILEVLFDLGGRGSTDAVFRGVETLIGGFFRDGDFQAAENGDLVWRRSAETARQTLANFGLIRVNSDGDAWELTEEGKREAAKAKI